MARVQPTAANFEDDVVIECRWSVVDTENILQLMRTWNLDSTNTDTGF